MLFALNASFKFNDCKKYFALDPETDILKYAIYTLYRMCGI